MASRPRAAGALFRTNAAGGLRGTTPSRRGGGAPPVRAAGVRAQARVPARGGRGTASRGTGGGG